MRRKDIILLGLLLVFFIVLYICNMNNLQYIDYNFLLLVIILSMFIFAITIFFIHKK